MLITSSNNGEFLHLLADLKRVSVRPQPRRFRDSTIVSQDVDALALQSYIGMDKSLGILSPSIYIYLSFSLSIFSHHIEFLCNFNCRLSVCAIQFPEMMYHMPLASLMYSHGNAFDSGQMYELCINLSIHLCVNLDRLPRVAYLCWHYHSSMTIPHTRNKQQQAFERVSILTIGLTFTDITWCCTAP
ncbi:hypothetical protein IGI04_014464 [Brassica rapa subsp. trilocularis]|uniref:Uncharacterized protein n=1 Tax=Brassica rapa subsp. trilocularis TaxID=1813537 RepID=A0ABQ7MM91_BRACM|nr:hypothetical protein IGI04_014464 [Brassica rapa subsp. trilocularis]